MTWTKLPVVFIVLQAVFTTVDGVRCFQCQNYPSPSICSDVTTCTKDDFCYVEEYITTSGHVVYNSGCMTKNRCANSGNLFGRRQTDLLVCSECCQGELCNNAGCNKQAIPRDQRGPYCYSCDFMTDPAACDKVTICPQDQQCSLYVPKEFNMYQTLLYSAGCQTNETCDTLSVMSNHAICPPTCCTDDFCNTKCGTPITATSTLPTSTVTTPSTTPSNTPTTTKSPSITPSTTPTKTSPTTTTPPTMPTTTKSPTITPSTTPTNTSPTTTTPPTTPTTTKSPTITPSTTPTNTSPTTTTPPTMPTMTKSPTITPSTKPTTTPLTNPTTTESTTVTTTTTAMPTTVLTTRKVQCGVNSYYNVPVPNSPNGLCIRVGQSEKTWDEARTSCRNQNADLLILDTNEKISAVKQYLKHNDHGIHGDIFWIGAHNINTNNLVWVDGQKVVHWERPDSRASSQIQPAHDDNCVLINGHENFGWNHVKCDEHRVLYICERK